MAFEENYKQSFCLVLNWKPNYITKHWAILAESTEKYLACLVTETFTDTVSLQVLYISYCYN